MKKIAALVVFVAASGGLAGMAWGAPHNTPTGWTGACNMVVAWSSTDYDHGVAVGIQTNGGMQTAMNADNAHGNDGMNTAVTNSNGYCP